MINKTLFIELTHLTAYLILLSSFVIVLYTFGAAFDHETKEITISINQVGEANFELIMLSIFIMIVTFSAVYKFNKFVKS